MDPNRPSQVSVLEISGELIKRLNTLLSRVLSQLLTRWDLALLFDLIFNKTKSGNFDRNNISRLHPKWWLASGVPVLMTSPGRKV